MIREDLPLPKRTLFEDEAGFQTAIDELLAQARHELMIFDQSLVLTRLDSPERVDRLASFLHNSRRNRIQVVVHDARRVSAYCPRFLNLLRQFGHALAVRVTQGDARTANDVLLLADGQHYVRRAHVDRPRGVVVTDDPNATLPLLNRFGEIWQASRIGISATTSGL